MPLRLFRCYNNLNTPWNAGLANPACERTSSPLPRKVINARYARSIDVLIVRELPT